MLKTANKENKLKTIIIIVSSVALLGIAAIQYYYIRTAVLASEATFDRNVNEGMSKVIFQIEKNEIASQVRKKLKSFSREQALINTLDSLNQNLFRSLKKIGIDTMRTDSIIRKTRFDISEKVAMNQYGEYLKNIDTTKIDTMVHIPQADSILRMELPFVLEKRIKAYNLKKEFIKNEEKKINNLYSDVDRFLRRTYLIGDVMEDFFNINHFFPIESRIDSAKTDSMVRSELAFRSINVDFVFGIYSSKRDTLMMQSKLGYDEELKKSKYGYRLFPSDMFSAPDYLMLYFPHKKAFIYSNIRGLLIISLVLVVVIAFSFFFILFNLLRQKRLSEMKTDFINNMTHEIKTPISTISLACEMVKDNSTALDKEQYENLISVIAEENKRLASMSEKILQTAIMERGGMNLKKELVDIHSIIENSAKNINLWIVQKHGKITLNLQAKKHFAYVDKVHFENVMFNLLDNAIKYSSSKPEITVSTINQGGNIVISIEDKGIGIDKKEIKKIFESLYRVPKGDVHNVKGYGLGLCYVKEIVKEHDGKISVKSEVGEGSTFIIKISAYEE